MIVYYVTLCNSTWISTE